jgi:hypothetical protein
MKFLRILFFAILASQAAYANIAITNWNETIQLTDEGKKTTVSIFGKVTGVEQGKALAAYSINFDEKQKINVVGAEFDGKPVPFVFKKHEFRIDFPTHKVNGQQVLLGFSYEEKYSEISKHIRNEMIYVPKYAKGSIARIRIDFPDYDMINFIPKVVKSEGVLTYTVPVGEDGLKKLFKFTAKESAWDVESDIRIQLASAAGEMKVKIPHYFDSARQQVISKKMEFNRNPIGKESKGEERWFYFNNFADGLLITEKARILAGSKHYKQVYINSFPFSKASDEESKLLMPILLQIKADKKYAGMPIYVAIGEFVNSYIKYDKALVGKRLSLEEIIKGKSGVCLEYARLYDGLARVAGIPSMVLNGIACGNEGECESHSWNKIFFVNRWIEVDPTWNLMSGIVSSSHIFAVADGKDQIQITYPNSAGKAQIDIDLKMKSASKN